MGGNPLLRKLVRCLPIVCVPIRALFLKVISDEVNYCIAGLMVFFKLISPLKYRVV
jgi:hypothetical protein